MEATLARVSAYPGVLGCAVVGTGPRPQLLRTTLDPAAADELVRVAPSLAELCRAAVRELDPQNDLEIVRLRTTKQREIMVVYSESRIPLLRACQCSRSPLQAPRHLPAWLVGGLPAGLQRA